MPTSNKKALGVQRRLSTQERWLIFEWHIDKKEFSQWFIILLIFNKLSNLRSGTTEKGQILAPSNTASNIRFLKLILIKISTWSLNP
jgi:hypothetical protein